jgi:hypothetical protein
MRRFSNDEDRRPVAAKKDTFAIRLIVASMGLIVAGLGLAMLVIDIMTSQESGGWRERSLYDLLTSRWMNVIILQDFADWLRRPHTLAFLNPPVVFVLDLIPQSLALIALGSLIVWRALR